MIEADRRGFWQGEIFYRLHKYVDGKKFQEQ